MLTASRSTSLFCAPKRIYKRWSLEPATGRPYVRAFSLSGTVPAFTCDCLRFVCAFTPRPKFDLCVSTSSTRKQCLRSEITSVVRVAHVLLLRFVADNMDVNTPASKRSQFIGNTAIVRKRCVIHKKSTCVCLRLSVYLPRLRGNAGTQGSTCGRL